MQQDIELMKRYCTEAGWQQRREYHESGPAPEWLALYRDIDAAREMDPRGSTGRALAQRWNAMLDEESAGDPEIRAALQAAWSDRAHWSATLRWRLEGLSMMAGEHFDRAASFLAKARLAIDR